MFGRGESSVVWEWDGGLWHGVTPAKGPAPDPGGWYTLVYDVRRERSVVIGQRLGLPAETWAWDGQRWAGLSADVRPPSASAAAYDTARDRVVLGAQTWTPSGFVLETWEFDGDAWALRQSGGVALGWGGVSMCYDPVRGATIMRTAGPPDEPRDWAWSGTSWAAAGQPGDAWPGGGALVFDAARGRMLMLAADNGAIHTLAWNGEGWEDTGSGRIPERSLFGLAYDAARRTVLLYGGESPCEQPLCPVRSDLWQLPVVNADCPADWDCSGSLNSADFFAFLGSFFDGGDFNADGARDSRDFFDYLHAFFSGCG
jgi:hypothetical protein